MEKKEGCDLNTTRELFLLLENEGTDTDFLVCSLLFPLLYALDVCDGEISVTS